MLCTLRQFVVQLFSTASVVLLAFIASSKSTDTPAGRRVALPLAASATPLLSTAPAPPSGASAPSATSSAAPFSPAEQARIRSDMDVLERSGASARDEEARESVATALLSTRQQQELPDDVGKRTLALATARRPSPKLATLLAELVVRVDAERLGLASELRALATL